jgi:RimJ/RimL family protein N-acetyltransferase
VTPSLETPRLWLRALELADAEQAQSLFPQWEVVRYLTNKVPWPFPPDGVLAYYRDVALPQAARGEAWHWTLRLKSAPQRLIGCTSLMKSDEINRGFWLGVPWHGRGLMSEASGAVTNYWFDTLGFPMLRIPKAAVNAASRRISERQGMRLIETREDDYVSGRLRTEVWEITADEWRAHRAQNEVIGDKPNGSNSGSEPIPRIRT